MANKELATSLSSGAINNIQIGGTTSNERVQVKADMVSTNISFDDTGLGITASNLQLAVAALSEVGLVVMSGSSLAVQNIDITPTKVLLFETKDVEEGVGAVGDIVLDRATATLDGTFKIRFEAFVSYANNVDITWQLYKNGVQFGNSITLTGQGANVFPIILITSIQLLTDDYLELYATASAATDITVSQANGTLEKTIF